MSIRGNRTGEQQREGRHLMRGRLAHLPIPLAPSPHLGWDLLGDDLVENGGGAAVRLGSAATEQGGAEVGGS